MPSEEKPSSAGRDLGQEVRAQEEPFIEQAVALLREALRQEYPRLRGYAYERETHAIDLDVRIRCEFSSKRIRVKVQTQPSFTPPVLEFGKEVLCAAP